MRRSERGAIAVFTAISATAMLVVAGLAIDIGNTWAHRGQLQVQADRAAVYGAQFLPAGSVEGERKVAKAVAYYIACNPVSGQRELQSPSNPIPACPSTGPGDGSLDSYADWLLAQDMVTFPVRNQVKVVTPEARIDYGFGKAAGADGSIQHKQAIARVNSPGMLSPMALSLDCMLNAGSNLFGGGVPFGYISTTHKSNASSTITTTWPTASASDPNLTGSTPGRISQPLPLLPAPTVAINVSGRKWPELTAGQSWVVVFAQGSGLTRKQAEVPGTLVLDDVRRPQGSASITINIPEMVQRTSGTWQIKVAISVGGVLQTSSFSADTASLDVDPLVAIDDIGDVSCGRLIKSPRAGTQANENFTLNLQEGIDHLVTQYPTLASTGPLDLAGLQALVGATTCGSQRVVDTNGVKDPDIPNCLVTNMSNAYEAGFTEGMIGANGRLTCTSAHPCRPSETFTIPGYGSREFNDDEFSDFIVNPGLMSWQTFFNVDSYLKTGLPVVTPTSNLDREIYNSHRFMWVAVISTAGAVSAVQAGDYPVLTFRPIFITQVEALNELPLLDPTGLSSLFGNTVPMTVSLIDTSMRTLLSGDTEQRGLMMDSSGKLSAVRFLTVSPDALPAVPAEYDGAESEYLGVGPRIIRLVK